MNASAAHRKVSYVDRNAVVGYGRNDYQNSALGELCGSASAAHSTINRDAERWSRASKSSYSIAAQALISRSRSLFYAA
jgi:hypothetical protein